MLLYKFAPLALTALLTVTSAGPLHDRRRQNLFGRLQLRTPPSPAPVAEADPANGIPPVVNSTDPGLIVVPDGSDPAATLSESLVLPIETAAPIATELCTAATVTITETVVSISVSTLECQTPGGDAGIATTIVDAVGSTIVHPPAATDVDNDGEDDDEDAGDEDNNDVDDDEDDRDEDDDNIFIPAPTPPQKLPPVQSEAPAEFEDGDVTTNIISQTVTLGENHEIVNSFDPEEGFVEITITHPAETVTEVVEQVVTVSKEIVLTTSEEGVAPTETAVPDNEAEVGEEDDEVEEMDEAEETEDNDAIATETAAEDDADVVIISTVFVHPIATPIADPNEVDDDASDEDDLEDDADEAADGITVIKTITLTLSKEPILITTIIDGQLLEVTTTPPPELILSTVTLVNGGETGTGGTDFGTGTDVVVPPVETGGAGGIGNGGGKKNKKLKKAKKVKAKGNAGGNGVGKGKGRGGDGDEDEADD